jgi:hypothetical protein
VSEAKEESAIFSILLVLGGTLLVCVLVFVGFWANDLRQDRRSSVIVHSSTPLFVGSGNNFCYRQAKIALTVEAGTSVRVRRIRYWKDCATVDVSLPNGQRGYFVLGVRDFSVNPAPRSF